MILTHITALTWFSDTAVFSVYNLLLIMITCFFCTASQWSENKDDTKVTAWTGVLKDERQELLDLLATWLRLIVAHRERDDHSKKDYHYSSSSPCWHFTSLLTHSFTVIEGDFGDKFVPFPQWILEFELFTEIKSPCGGKWWGRCECVCVWGGEIAQLRISTRSHSGSSLFYLFIFIFCPST